MADMLKQASKKNFAMREIIIALVTSREFGRKEGREGAEESCRAENFLSGVGRSFV